MCFICVAHDKHHLYNGFVFSYWFVLLFCVRACPCQSVSMLECVCMSVYERTYVRACVYNKVQNTGEMFASL